MNGLVIVLIGIVALGAGYLLYGRWLAKKWGLDPKAKTPAYTKEDGQDYVPSSKFTVFSHQFSSIAGAGPVTGPILASVFGWVPVLLWLIVGGLFFGAVQDFGALYASVKNEGKSMGMIIEKYIGKTGRKLFMLFCWLFTLLVIAAFTDMVAGTFVGKGEGITGTAKAYADSAAASISMLFIVVAIVFGIIQKSVGKMTRCYWFTCCYVCRWYAFSDLRKQRCLDLHRYGLSVFGFRTSDVASHAAKRLYDNIHAFRYDCWCSCRSHCCSSGYEVKCL